MTKANSSGVQKKGKAEETTKPKISMKQVSRTDEEEAKLEEERGGITDEKLENHDHEFLMDEIFVTDNPSTGKKEMVVVYQCDYDVCGHQKVWTIGYQISHSDI